MDYKQKFNSANHTIDLFFADNELGIGSSPLFSQMPLIDCNGKNCNATNLEYVCHDQNNNTVAGVTTNTFQLSGINSSGYDAYSSGGTFTLHIGNIYAAVIGQDFS